MHGNFSVKESHWNIYKKDCFQLDKGATITSRILTWCFRRVTSFCVRYSVVCVAEVVPIIPFFQVLTAFSISASLFDFTINDPLYVSWKLWVYAMYTKLFWSHESIPLPFYVGSTRLYANYFWVIKPFSNQLYNPQIDLWKNYFIFSFCPEYYVPGT